MNKTTKYASILGPKFALVNSIVNFTVIFDPLVNICVNVVVIAI